MHVVGLRVEVGPVRPRRVREVAAGSVHEALGAAGRAGRVDDEERVLGVERPGLVQRGGGSHGVVPPDGASRGPRHVLSGAADDEHVLDRRDARDGLVGLRLGGDGRPAPVLPVARDEELRARVLDAEPQGLRGEAAEDERVHRADARDREGRDDRLDEHGKVDHDAVAGPDDERREGVGGAGHLLLEVAVGDRPTVAGLALEVQRDLRAASRRDVPVHAVGGDVEAAAREPGGGGDLRGAVGGDRRDPRVRRLPRRLPVEAAGGLLPEGDRIRLRAVVRLRRDVGGGGERGGRREERLLGVGDVVGRGVGLLGARGGHAPTLRAARPGSGTGTSRGDTEGAAPQPQRRTSTRSTRPTTASVTAPSTASSTIASSTRSTRPLADDSVSR